MDQTGWNQPVPGTPENTARHDSPFDEPEAAPELRKERSDSLYTRDEPFWNRVVDMPRPGEKVRRDPNYWNHPDVMDSDGMMSVPGRNLSVKIRRFLGSGVVRKTLAIVAVLVLVAVIVCGAFFRVRSIRVTGNTTIPEDEIVRLSGLQIGQYSMSIDDEAVMRRVESNRYLRCTLVDSRWDSVVIHVRERVPVAVLEYNGMFMTMDNRGFVLEESLNRAVDISQLVWVEGMQIRRGALGMQISVTNSAQLELYTQILVELKAMKVLELLEELDMTSMDSIYLRTRDGFQVRLGNESAIHEKLRAFTLTRERLIEMGRKNGVIDVTAPARPSYREALPEI